MDMIVEYACEKCGTQILKSDPIPLSSQTMPPGNKCNDCGFVTDISRVARFQWSPQLRSSIGRLCTTAEMNELRRAPQPFLLGTLNDKLIAAGTHPLEIDSTSKPVTIRQKA